MFKSYSWEIKSDLDKILKNYLGETRIKFFVEKVLFSSREPHIPLTGGHLNQPDDLKEATFSLTNVRLNFDHVIAFTEKILTKKKHLNLMLDLGKLSFQLGELNLSLEINSQVLSNIAGQPGFKYERVSACLQLFKVYSFQAKWKEAFSYAKQANNLLELPKDQLRIAQLENYYGAVDLERGELDNSLKYFNSAKDLMKGKKSPELRADISNNLGVIHTIRGELELALSYFNEALKIYKRMKVQTKITMIHHNLGMVHFKNKKYDKALNEYHKSLRLSRSSKNVPVLAILYVAMAHVYIKMDDLISAIKLLDKSFEIGNEINDRLSIADTYKLKGVVERLRKNYELAENFLIMSYRLNNELNNKLNFAESNFELGILYSELNNKAGAKKHFKIAYKHFKKIGAKFELESIDSYLKL